MVSFLMPNVSSVSYDITHDDPEDDVITINEDGEPEVVTGHDDIDILSIKSSKMTVKQNIVLEMTVAGTIVNSDNHTYTFDILDGEDSVYMVYYQNGVAIGMDFTDFSSELDETVLIATGTGTDTLKVTIPLNELGSITNFEISGSGMEMNIDEDIFEMYFDSCPDDDSMWSGDIIDDWVENVVLITEPKYGSTVYDLITIKGITDNTEAKIQSVEVQIDSTSKSGWTSAVTSDEWSTWSFQWDTTDVNDGKHTINVRANDGLEYHTDSIHAYVDQSSKISPAKVDYSSFHIGDFFEYEMSMNPDLDEMLAEESVSGTMRLTIADSETVLIKGKSFEAFEIDMYSEQKYGDGMFSFTMTSEGTMWVQRSNLAIIKQESKYEMPAIFGEEAETEVEVSIYDPPADEYDFPIIVGERWEVESTVTSTTTYTSDGDSDTDTDTYDELARYECLRTEEVTVPAGTFDAFLIYYEEGLEDEDGWEEDEFYNEDPGNDVNGTDGSNGNSGGNGIEVSSEEDTEYEYAMDGYTIEYYSPDVGFSVKIEFYDWNRELQYSLDLVSYKYGKKSSEPSEQDPGFFSVSNFESPVGIFLLIIIIIVLVIIGIVISKKRRKKKQAEQFYGGITGEPRVVQQVPLQPGTAQIPQVQPVPVPRPVAVQPTPVPQYSSVQPTPVPSPVPVQPVPVQSIPPALKPDVISTVTCTGCTRPLQISPNVQTMYFKCPYCGTDVKRY
jgi:hypothetical protein